MSEGLLIQSENLEALRQIPEASVDLIYLDPPFRSENIYKTAPTSDKSLSLKIFDDRWSWGNEYEAVVERLCDESPIEIINLVRAFERLFGRDGRFAYLLFMIERLLELRRILKSTGSIALHCDQSASAMLKLSMDSIFGHNNYLNTIVWCYGLGGSSPRRYPRKHDDIHWYSKEQDMHYFWPPLELAKSQRMKGKSKKIPDFWYIPSINNMAHERTGYPTQKPLALLERIVISSSPLGGKVLDPFCGSGTTLVAAARNDRCWIGIDVAVEAVETSIRRLESEGLDRNMTFQKREIV